VAAGGVGAGVLMVVLQIGAQRVLPAWTHADSYSIPRMAYAGELFATIARFRMPAG
jgi:hypothetical protein